MHKNKIHQRSIRALTIEICKTLNDLNPVFMKEIFCLKQYNYHMRNKSLDQNPRTVTYGLETFGYKATQLWNSILREIQEANDICKDIPYREIRYHTSTRDLDGSYSRS